MRSQANRFRASLFRFKQRCDERYGKLSSFVQFGFVGGTGVVVNLAALTGWQAAGVPVKYAYGLAIWVAMTSNFWLNRQLTFGHIKRRPLLSQYLHYAASNSVGSAISWAVSVILVHTSAFFQAHDTLAALPGILAGMAFNFLISFHWVFRAHRPAAGSTGAPMSANTTRTVPKNSTSG